MADKAGLGGLVWFIVGLLIGVAGTLAAQKLIQSGVQERYRAAQASRIQAASAAPPSLARPKLVLHQGGLSSSRPEPIDAAAGQTPSDVADDAAAAGMTSHAQPAPQPVN